MNLTVERHWIVKLFTGIDLRVLVDGVDVTDRCIEASPEYGWAECYALNAEGHKYIDDATRKAVVEALRGTVTVGSSSSWATSRETGSGIGSYVRHNTHGIRGRLCRAIGAPGE